MISKKILLLIGGVIAAIIILSAVLILLRKPEAQSITNIQTIDETLENIQNGGDIDNCQRLTTDEEKDQCYFSAVMTRQESSICEFIINENLKSDCSSLITLNQIRQNNDFNGCLNLQRDTYRQDCIVVAITSGAGEDFCNNFTGDENVYCQDQVFFQKGIQDKSECDNIRDEDLKTECLTSSTERPAVEVRRIDSDNDGLTDDEEIRLGTDPENPDTDSDGLNDFEEVRTYGTDSKNRDTDNDGFDDGTEVRGGYNPRGTGRLE